MHVKNERMERGEKIMIYEISHMISSLLFLTQLTHIDGKTEHTSILFIPLSCFAAIVQFSPH